MEARERAKTFEEQVLERLTALEYRVGVLVNEVGYYSITDGESGQTKTLLKGRVDDLEREVRELQNLRIQENEIV